MKKKSDEKFWIFLVPSWILSGFFFLIFIKNAGWPPRTPVTINDIAYLIVSFIFFVVPFISSMKLGKLIEFERKLNETREDMYYFKNDTRQMFAAFSAVSTTARSVLNVYSVASEGQVQKREQQEKPKTAIELKILNTLWNRQVNKFPELDTFFTFRLNATSSEFLEFREAGNRLMGKGLISETDTGQFFLTDKGIRYCAKNYKDFPADMWFNYIPLDEAKLKNLLKKLT